MNHIIPILKEMLSKPKLRRVPEQMVMVHESQTQDFFNYGLGDTALRAAYLFHAKWASKTFANCKRVLDLGTGPAYQLSILAQMNTSIEFVGVDLSGNMLELAQNNCAKLGLKNVKLVQDDMTQLSKLKDGEFDGVFSSVAFHHLPNAADVEETFKNARRVLKDRYSVYITDFLLVKNEQSIHYLVSLNETQPAVFKQDYEASLRASFPKSDFQSSASKYLDEAELHTSFGAQFLMILKTPSYELTPFARRLLNSELERLSPATKSIYKSIAVLMALRGMF